MINVAVRRLPTGEWQAVARTPSGLLVHATVSETSIRNFLARNLETRAPGAMSAGLWSGLKKIARKVAKARVIRKLAKAYKRVARSPLVARAVGIAAQSFGVPAPVAEGILRGTTKLSPGMLAAGLATGQLQTMGAIAALRGKKGRKALAGSLAAAQAGDPKAIAVVRKIARASRKFKRVAKLGRGISKLSRLGNPRARALVARAKATMRRIRRYRIMDPAGRQVATFSAGSAGRVDWDRREIYSLGAAPVNPRGCGIGPVC